MSVHFEVVFCLFLREDTPGAVISELRWHLGEDSSRPSAPAISSEAPLLASDGSYLPGPSTATLQRQLRSSGHDAWAFYLRQYWLDDQFGEVWWQIAEWLAPYAEDDGYAGFFRTEDEENLTVLAVRGGVPYLIEHGKDPVPLRGDSA